MYLYCTLQYLSSMAVPRCPPIPGAAARRIRLSGVSVDSELFSFLSYAAMLAFLQV